MLHAACRCNCMVHLIKKLKTKIKTIKNTTMLMLLQCAMSMSFACAAMQQVRGNGQSTGVHETQLCGCMDVCM